MVFFRLILREDFLREKDNRKMERGKTGTGRGAKSKIAQHPADLFALGAKSSRGEATDSKRPGVIHGKPGASSSTSGQAHILMRFQESQMCLKICRTPFLMIYILRRIRP